MILTSTLQPNQNSLDGDMGRALRMCEKMQSGTVWVNTYRAIATWRLC